MNTDREDMRWNVELPQGNVFEDVGAASLDIDGGCLVFRDEDGVVLVGYGADYWKTVSGQ